MAAVLRERVQAAQVEPDHLRADREAGRRDAGRADRRGGVQAGEKSPFNTMEKIKAQWLGYYCCRH